MACQWHLQHQAAIQAVPVPEVPEALEAADDCYNANMDSNRLLLSQQLAGTGHPLMFTS
jgi:hypothetical protein